MLLLLSYSHFITNHVLSQKCEKALQAGFSLSILLQDFYAFTSKATLSACRDSKLLYYTKVIECFIK